MPGSRENWKGLSVAVGANRLTGIKRRFLAKVKITDGCWGWIGSITAAGYAQFHIGIGLGNRAHRASWLIYKGPIPKGKSVLHSCDNRSCTNPEHLFLGEQIDNMHDMISKGRKKVGSQTRNAKITESDVIAIRKKYSTGNFSYQQIADNFGMEQSTIADIVKGYSWKHVLEGK